MLACVRAQRPVVVLARTVNPLERLFVQQDHKSVFAGNLVHQVHHNLILVVGQIGFTIDRSQLELVRGNLIVSGLERNAEPQAGDLKLAHELSHACRDGGEVMVLQLLVLRGIVPHQGPACNHQVSPCGVERLVNQEILLLPSQIGVHLGDLGVKKLDYWNSCIGDGLECFFQGSLVVQSLSGVGQKDSWNAKGVILNEDRGCRIPGGVAPGLEGGPDAPVGK